jgi:hypothetical protein
MKNMPSNVSDDFEAYRLTNYIAWTPLGEICLRVGVRNEKLAELLEPRASRNWAFITAFNPASLPRTREENIARQQQLESTLRKERRTFFPGEGIGDDPQWPPEQSVLVLDIDRATAGELAKEFGQNAILAGDERAVPELVDCRD